MDRKLTLLHTTNPDYPDDPLGIHEYYLNIISTMPNNVYWLDKNCITQGCNNNVLKLLGLTKLEDFIGITYKKMGELAGWTEGQAEFFMRDDLDVISTGRAKVNVEEPPLYDAAGHPIYYVSTRVPLFDRDKNVIGVVGISVDITQRKNIEEQLRISKERAEAANKAKSVFIANMSHDIRTPITGVIGIADILDKEGDTTKDREYGHIIHDSSERLLSLLNDILEIVSADEIKEENLQFQTFSLKERIEHVKELFYSNIKIKQVDFEVIITPNLPEYIVSDRIKLDRILLNLISNALKFTDKGYVKFNCQLLSSEADNAIIEFVVSDSGVGIPADKMDKIFDRFYRVTPSYEGRYAGYGIGLFIVKRFVNLLGGEIEAQSELEKGTIFTVTLPVKIGKKEDAVKNLKELAPHPKKITADKKMLVTSDLTSDASVEKKQNGLKVLFIEDDNIAIRTGQYFLESADFSVQTVSDGEKAIKYAKTQDYDLIISDIGLPGMDGNEFTLLYRHWEKKSGKCPLPIIGLSAHASGKTKEEALEVGMDDILAKPLNEQKIKEILQIMQNYKENKEKKQVQKLNPKSDDTPPKTLGLDLPATEAQLFKLEQYLLFDEKEGLKVTGNDGDMLNELLIILVKETIPEELANIENAHKTSDWESIQELAHKLKGAALYCGTPKMRYACQYLERYRLAGYSKLLEELYQQLLTVLQETRSFVIKFLGKTK